MIEVAPATPADLDAIDAIEQHSFPRPWPRETFAAELVRPGSLLVVARGPRGVVGFCNGWIVVDELHVLAIATAPDHRRAGIGGELLRHALATARAAGCVRATLEVRRGNVPAIALYARHGFATVHVRTGYYADNQEDGLVMIAEPLAPAT